jgi:hypothetical protein
MCITLDSLSSNDQNDIHTDITRNINSIIRGFLALPDSANIYKQEILSGKIKRNQIIALTCLDRASTHFSLNSLSGGFYEAKLFVLGSGVLFEKANAFLDVRSEEVFTPSYEWQELHAWHNAVPGGLEIR